MNFKLGELFCGPGGMALGAKLAAEQFQKKYGGNWLIEHVWGVDRDPNAIKTYNVNNLGEGIQCDAMAFAESRYGCDHKTISSFKPITALAFGFPCNDFSMVGQKKGLKGDYGLLYKAGIEAINHTNPKWFIAENVSGIHSANAGEAFKQILSELAAAGKGYDLTVNLYKFEDYGVPQYRHRYIIVGIRKDQKVKFKIPAPTHLKHHVSVKTALTRPYEDGVTGRELTRQQSQIEERLLFTPPWRNAWYLEEMLDMSAEERRAALAEAPWYKEKLQHLSNDQIIERIKACRLHCTRARMSHIYRRLHPDKPSYTITGSGGGGTHVYHWKECRALTNRERARLQGFPDWFEFKGQKEQVRKQIGMAVPPEGAKVIFEAILKTFAGIEYEFVDPSYKPEENA
jgi:DNA (cytosine-5)-methyltransferase 1